MFGFTYDLIPTDGFEVDDLVAYRFDETPTFTGSAGQPVVAGEWVACPGGQTLYSYGSEEAAIIDLSILAVERGAKVIVRRDSGDYFEVVRFRAASSDIAGAPFFDGVKVQEGLTAKIGDPVPAGKQS